MHARRGTVKWYDTEKGYGRDMNSMLDNGSDEVGFLNGRTRMFGIVGHPIEQVRSPEMFTAEFMRRGANALLLPIHILPEDFDQVLPNVMRIQNLDGLVFTIPYKIKACGLAGELGPQASIVGAVNALARRPDGRWHADIFDGIGCVEAFRRRNHSFAGQRVMLIGAGGAGSAIGVAIAHEGPARMRLFDLDTARVEDLADKIRKVNSDIAVEIGAPSVSDQDILLNASPVGMLDDERLPIASERLPSSLVVFDAIVKPERTHLLQLAEACGCSTIYGREMMRGQIERVTDYFGLPRAGQL